MADTHAKMTQATPQEVIVSIAAGLLAPLLAIFLIIQLVLGIQGKHIADTDSDAAVQATVERIRPVAQLAALDANAPRVEQSGQQVFDAVCTSCHTPGALGAPKFNNKGDWAARLAQGFDTLTSNAINGIRQMPARGGNPDLSDTEVARAVAYMANSAGASFKEPEAAAPAGEAAAPAASAKPDAAAGKAVYDANCAACHASARTGTVIPLNEIGTDRGRIDTWGKQAAIEANQTTQPTVNAASIDRTFLANAYVPPDCGNLDETSAKLNAVRIEMTPFNANASMASCKTSRPQRQRSSRPRPGTRSRSKDVCGW